VIDGSTDRGREDRGQAEGEFFLHGFIRRNELRLKERGRKE